MKYATKNEPVLYFTIRKLYNIQNFIFLPVYIAIFLLVQKRYNTVNGKLTITKNAGVY